MATLPPPPLDNVLAQTDGMAAPPWNKWLQLLWEGQRGFRATEAINTTWTGSPASISSSSFKTSGGTLLLLSVASGWRPSTTGGPGLSGFDVQVDGSNRATVEMWCNELDSHRVFPAAFSVLTGVAAGDHTVTLVKRAATTQADLADAARVTVIEFPF